jgi:hypothetical protein
MGNANMMVIRCWVLGDMNGFSKVCNGIFTTVGTVYILSNARQWGAPGGCSQASSSKYEGK